MRPIPYSAGLYLAILQLVFALGWTVYAIYLPKLAAEAGIPAGAVIFIVMLDQAIFTVTDFTVGVATDRISRVVGRLGHWAAAVTLVSCAAFVCLPLVASAGLGAKTLLGLTVIWAVTSSALRAPPLMLLGKYAARPAIPYLASLAMSGVGIASAISPYLARTLAGRDPRLPFAISSITLMLVTLALVMVERTLAKQAPPDRKPPNTIDRAVPGSIVVFGLAIVVFALGSQLHVFFNSAPLFKKFTSDTAALTPVFPIGFSIGMFPASLVTKRWGGLPVMGAAGMLGAIAIVIMENSGTLGVTVAAQLIAGAAWGAILMSAFAAAAALGATGHEGKTTGLLFSALALAALARMTAAASGALGDTTLARLLQWGPILCWALAGAALLALCVAVLRKARAKA